MLEAGTAIAGAAAGLAGVGAWGAFSPRSRLFGPVIWRGDASGVSRVALTFDDGPHPQATPAILAILRDHHVTAAFFVIGLYAARHVELLQRIHAEGHLVGNHSFDHAYSGMVRGGRYWRAQIARNNDAIEAAIGVRPQLFRPPMGFKQRRIMRAVQQASHTTVTWSRRAFDGVATTPEAIHRRLAGPSRAGDILLLHDGVASTSRRDWRPTCDALPRLIEGLRRRGLEPAPLDTLIGTDAYASPNARQSAGAPSTEACAPGSRRSPGR